MTDRLDPATLRELRELLAEVQTYDHWEQDGYVRWDGAYLGYRSVSQLPKGLGKLVDGALSLLPALLDAAEDRERLRERVLKLEGALDARDETKDGPWHYLVFRHGLWGEFYWEVESDAEMHEALEGFKRLVRRAYPDFSENFDVEVVELDEEFRTVVPGSPLYEASLAAREDPTP